MFLSTDEGYAARYRSKWHIAMLTTSRWRLKWSTTVHLRKRAKIELGCEYQPGTIVSCGISTLTLICPFANLFSPVLINNRAFSTWCFNVERWLIFWCAIFSLSLLWTGRDALIFGCAHSTLFPTSQMLQSLQIFGCPVENILLIKKNCQPSGCIHHLCKQ